MTKFFYDTEFLEDGNTINLISIGIISENGMWYYAVNSEADWSRIYADDWLVENVVSQLPPEGEQWKTKAQIADDVLAMLTSTTSKPELWAWYSAYDHVALAQLWGKMIDLPEGIPMFTNDFRSYVDFVDPRLKHQLPKQPSGNHDALEDAKHLRLRYNFVEDWRATHQ